MVFANTFKWAGSARSNSNKYSTAQRRIVSPCAGTLTDCRSKLVAPYMVVECNAYKFETS